MKVKRVTVLDDHVDIDLEDRNGDPVKFSYAGQVSTSLQGGSDGYVHLSITVGPRKGDGLSPPLNNLHF